MYKITDDDYIFTKAKKFIDWYSQTRYYIVIDQVDFENEALPIYARLKELGDSKLSSKINKITGELIDKNLVCPYVRTRRKRSF